MYRLTDKRLHKATAILEKYRAELCSRFQFRAMALEVELRRCWNVGYQELKGIARDMLQNERYKHVAVYYMEHVNCPGPVMEFQAPLAKVYGIKWFHAPERKQKQNEFWASFKASVERGEIQ